MSTIKDVANLANVSVATVSRVINSSDYVSEETRAKVLNAIEELKYKPSSAARVLAGKKMMSIALVVPDISNPFFSELARAVEDVAQKNGFSLFIGNFYNKNTREKDYIKSMSNKYIDGFIFASSTLTEEDIDTLIKKEIPMVVMDRAATIGGCTVIKCKNYDGACIATNHLIQLGCREIAHISGPGEFVTSMERLKGFEDTLKSHGLYNPSLISHGDFTIDGGRQAMRSLLNTHPNIDGVFAANDLMAIGAMKELKAMGKEVPRDVSVCGFDGVQIGDIVEPGLTTIAQPIYELGSLASQTVIDATMGKFSSKDTYELDIKLVERGSTGKMRV